MIKTTAVILALLVGLMACNSDHDHAAVRMIYKGLEVNNVLLRKANADIYVQLEEKLKDPQTNRKAEIWFPKAQAVKKCTDDVVKYIHDLKRQIGALKEDNRRRAKRLLDTAGKRLYYALLAYNNEAMLSMDLPSFADNPLLLAQLQKDTARFKQEAAIRFGIKKDSVTSDLPGAAAWMEGNLNHTSPLLALAVLSKLEHDALLTENNLVDYCNKNTTTVIHSYEVFRAIAVINSSYLKVGETVEINAGVGAFEIAGRRRITINGKVFKPEEDGVVVYRFAAKQTPGKYTVPIVIEFTRPDGSISTITRKLKYTVVP